MFILLFSWVSYGSVYMTHDKGSLMGSRNGCGV